MMLSWLSVIAALLCAWCAWRRWRLRRSLPQPGHAANWHLWLSMLCILAALACVNLYARAIAGKARPEPRIAFVLDCSESMLAGTEAANRLEEGKGAIRAVAEGLRHCELALVTYSGDAFVDCPPTDDRIAFEAALASAAPGSLYLPGSAPEQGMRQAEALNAIMVILVTDGEMNPPDASAGALWRARKGALAAIVCGEVGRPRKIPHKNGVLYDEATGRPALTTPAKEGLIAAAALSSAPFGGVFEAATELDRLALYLREALDKPPVPPAHYLVLALVLLLSALSIDPLVRWLRERRIGRGQMVQGSLALLMLVGLGTMAGEAPAQSEQALRAALDRPGLSDAERARLHSNLAALLCQKAQETPEETGRLAAEALQSARTALQLKPGYSAAAVNLEVAQRLVLRDALSSAGGGNAHEREGGEPPLEHTAGRAIPQAMPQADGTDRQEAAKAVRTAESSFGTWRDLRESAARRQLRAAPQGVKPW